MGFVDELDSVAKNSSYWNAEREKAKEEYIRRTVETIKNGIKQKVESGTFDSKRGTRAVSFRFTLGSSLIIPAYSNGKDISIIVVEKEVKRGLLSEKFSVAFTQEGIEIVKKLLKILEANSIESKIGVEVDDPEYRTARDIVPFDIKNRFPYYQHQSVSFFLDCTVLF